MTRGFGPRNWFTGTYQGAWTAVHGGISGGITVTLAFMSIIFFGLMTTGMGQPEDTRGVDVSEYVTMIADTISALSVGLFYMIITLVFLVGWWLESKSGQTPLISIIDTGPSRDWIYMIPFGIAIGAVFGLAMEFGIGSFYPFETITVFGVNVEPLIMFMAPVLAIPIAEELFFGGVMTPTIAEALGIISAAILVSLVWIMWHLGTYNTAPEIMVALFAFRFIFTFIILYTKSLMPAIVAHVVVNMLGTLFAV